MLTAIHGRVEMDPMGIPRPASMDTGTEGSFAEALQQATAPQPTERVDPRHPDPERVDDVDGDAPHKPELPRPEEMAAAATECTAAPQDAAPRAFDDAPTAATADVTDEIRRGEPVRQEAAGKGADSPRTSSSPQLDALLAAAVQHTANTNGPAFGVAARETGVGAVGAASATGNSLRGSEAPGTKPGAALRTPATTGAYRTNSAASAELLEQARDSVFKQILVKLTGDGGEMRVRLEPPDLGELDLRLVVQDGNRLQLTIAAEREDLAQLLQKHLAELTNTLQQAGIEVTSTSVQTRSEFEREHGRRDAQAHAADPAFAVDDDEPTTDHPARRGYVSASGLDFWA